MPCSHFEETTMSVTEQQALAIKQRFETDVLKQPGVTGVDLGQGAGGAHTLRVYVASRASAPKLPDHVEGLPVEIVERRFGLQ